MSRPEEEYREFVGSRAASLHRTAYLLCGDWHLASDLVQETFVQTFRYWRRVQRAGVDLSLADPLAQRLRGPDPELRGHRHDRRPI
jgi:DNA-directed RNA polymerase specialized sigma24 family protein